ASWWSRREVEAAGQRPRLQRSLRRSALQLRSVSGNTEESRSLRAARGHAPHLRLVSLQFREALPFPLSLAGLSQLLKGARQLIMRARISRLQFNSML